MNTPESTSGPAPQAGPPLDPRGLPYAYPPRRPTNSMAVAAFVVGLVSLISCPLIGGVAVYLGNRARAEIRASGEDGDGLALAGLIVGWCALGLAVVMILFLIIYFGVFAVAMAVSGAG